MKNKVLMISGIVAASGCALSVYFYFERKRQDQFATHFIRELTKLTNPSTTGLLSENAFDVHYKDEVVHQTGQPILALTNEAAKDLADEIHKALTSWSWWLSSDKEQRIYTVFRGLKDKVQVSQVSKAYLTHHKVNLIDKLQEELNDKQIKQVLSIIKPLPAFRAK